MNKSNKQKRPSGIAATSAPPLQEFVSARSRRQIASNIGLRNAPNTAASANCSSSESTSQNDMDLNDFPPLTRDQHQAQVRRYQALTTSSSRLGPSEVRALRERLEQAELSTGLVEHQYHLHGPCPADFFETRYLPSAVAAELQLNWREAQERLDALSGDSKYPEDNTSSSTQQCPPTTHFTAPVNQVIISGTSNDSHTLSLTNTITPSGAPSQQATTAPTRRHRAPAKHKEPKLI